MSSLDNQGEACRKLQAEFTAEGKTYNEQRKAQTAKLRAALTPVWTALKSGKTVNGQKGLEKWAAWFNPVAKYPLRQLQRVMGEPTEKSETTSRRLVKLVEGGVYIMPDGKKYVLEQHRQMHSSTRLAKQLQAKYGNDWSLSLVEEDETPVVTPKPKVTKKVACKLCGYKKCQCAEIQASLAAAPDKLAAILADDKKVKQAEEKQDAKGKPIMVTGLSKAQMREIAAVLSTGEIQSPKLTLQRTSITFANGEEYQRVGKLLIIALDKRTKELDIRPTTDHNDLDWHNRSPEGVAAKKALAISNGAIKACQGAAYAIADLITDDSDIDPLSLWEWKKAYEDEQEQKYYDELDRRHAERLALRRQKEMEEATARCNHVDREELSEPAKALAAVVDGTVENWGTDRKVTINVSKICETEE